jgi:hypothetical protein
MSISTMHFIAIIVRRHVKRSRRRSIGRCPRAAAPLPEARRRVSSRYSGCGSVARKPNTGPITPPSGCKMPSTLTQPARFRANSCEAMLS